MRRETAFLSFCRRALENYYTFGPVRNDQGARAKGRGGGGTSVLYEVDECSQMDEDENATDDEENAERQVG